MSQYALRRPYPFHLIVDGRGYMLGSPGPNQPALVSSKTQDISAVQPPDYNYAGLSPISERQEPYESLVLGMGLKTQENWQDARYANAMGVDCSVWPWCKGPDIVDTNALNGEVVAFFELGGTLYAAGGTQIASFNTGTGAWTVTATFGALILQATVFTSNFDGVPRAWVALQSGNACWSTNGTTWTAMATFTALDFTSVGREWWWANDTNQIRKCDTNANPTVEANYTANFRVGDKSAAITALSVTAAGTLLIHKTDGIYTLDGSGQDHQLYPFMQYAQITRNGKAWGQFLDDVYVAYGNSFARINPSLGLEEIGPERLINNDGPVRGQITAFAGLRTLFAYGGIYNPDTSRSYLMKFSGWVSLDAAPSQTGSTTVAGEAKRIDAWHGALNGGWSDGYISALFVSTIGAPAGHTRTYIGRSNGATHWLINPCVPNPAACSQYRFETGDAWVELPLWHGGYHASVKSIRHVAISSTFLDANNYVFVDLATNAVATPSPIAHNFQTPAYEQFNLPTTTTAVLARFRVHLFNTANTASPLVSAFIVGHALRPTRVMQFEADILCADGLVRRDGVGIRMGRQVIRQFIEAAVDNPGAVSCILPDEQVLDLSFTDYRISQAFDEVGRQWRGALRVRAVQWVS